MWQECALTTGFALPHLIKCFGKQSSSALTNSEAAQLSLAIWISFVSLTYWDFFLMAITFFFFMKEVGEICRLCSLQQWIHPSQKPSCNPFAIRGKVAAGFTYQKSQYEEDSPLRENDCHGAWSWVLYIVIILMKFIFFHWLLQHIVYCPGDNTLFEPL